MMMMMMMMMMMNAHLFVLLLYDWRGIDEQDLKES